MSLRTILFWCHLVAGVCAGAIILLMSFTGVLLMYERQLIAWGDSDYQSAPTSAGAPMPVEELVARVRRDNPSLQPSAITVRNEPTASVTIATGPRTLFVDAYSGGALGEAKREGIRAAMSTLREWHRWIAMSGDTRTTGRAITGWSNLVFLVIVCSGFYLWLPRRFTWQHVRPVLLFRGGLRGKPRDFNWHNVIGVWCAVPLFIVVLSAMPISFPWANAAVYRMVGEEPPPPAPRPATESRASAPVAVEGLDAALTRASKQVEGWRTITARLPAGRDGYVFTIDRGDGGQPHLRDTLTVDRSGAVVSFEPFASQTPGRRLRSMSRFAHTGEVLGFTGQTIAGVASAGAVVLVWTGIALAWRRFFGRRPSILSARMDGRSENAA